MSDPRLANHENIVGLLGLDFQEDYDNFKLAWSLLLVEYSEFGTLDAFQDDMQDLLPACSRDLLLDIGLGLQSLHSCNIVHGDVKSENVLIFAHPIRAYVAKLSDFGLAVVNPSGTEQHYLPGCTWLWCAPEAQHHLTVRGMQLTDVFSFGLTAWRVLSRRQDPFEIFRSNSVAPGNHREFVQHIKSSPSLPEMVQQTLSGIDFAVQVAYATLNTNSDHRSLESAIFALSEGGCRTSEV